MWMGPEHHMIGTFSTASLSRKKAKVTKRRLALQVAVDPFLVVPLHLIE